MTSPVEKDVVERAQAYLDANAAESGADVLIADLISELSRLRRQEKEAPVRDIDWRADYIRARDALYQFQYPPDPKMLREIADEIDCGSDCEYGHTEWDTNAHVCSRSERKEGCASEKAWHLRQFADAIDARVEIVDPLSPPSRGQEKEAVAPQLAYGPGTIVNPAPHAAPPMCPPQGYHVVRGLEPDPNSTSGFRVASPLPSPPDREAASDDTKCYECHGPLNGPYCPACSQSMNRADRNATIEECAKVARAAADGAKRRADLLRGDLVEWKAQLAKVEEAENIEAALRSLKSQPARDEVAP